MKIDHLGLAVRSLRDAVRFYEEALGMKVSGLEEIAGEGVRAAFLPAGGPRLELLEPLDGASPIARHLERRGEGIHHVCFEVDGIEEAVRRVEAAGAALIEPRIRSGAEGSRVAFVHPRSAHGVLVELREGGHGAGRTPSVAPGSVAVVYLMDPPGKVWGRVLSMDSAGISHQGVDLRSFDDLLRGAAAGEMGPRDLSVVYYPLRRVEKVMLDLGTETAPSLQDQFLARVGRSFMEFLGS